MREFNVFLNNRKKEYDVFVYNLPYREGLSFINRLVIDSHVDALFVFRTADIENRFDLTALVKDTSKVCYETPDIETVLNALADFNVLYAIMPEEDASFDVSAGSIDLFIASFTCAESALQIGTEPFALHVGKPLGKAESSVILYDSIEQILKTVYESGSTSVSVNAEIRNAGTQMFLNTRQGLAVAADVDGLFRLLDVGSVNSSVELFVSEVDLVVLGGVRLLKQMDDFTLSTYDRMILDDVYHTD